MPLQFLYFDVVSVLLFIDQFSIMLLDISCIILESDLLVGLLRHRNADRMCIGHGLANVIPATLLHILFCTSFLGYLLLNCFLFIDGTSSCL